MVELYYYCWYHYHHHYDYYYLCICCYRVCLTSDKVFLIQVPHDVPPLATSLHVAICCHTFIQCHLCHIGQVLDKESQVAILLFLGRGQVSWSAIGFERLLPEAAVDDGLRYASVSFAVFVFRGTRWGGGESYMQSAIL